MHRLRLAAVCAALTAMVFIQDPGRIAADTKLDLYVDPQGFLAKSLHLWEPLGFFGQLQNQAYGYLFPVGPFFVAGDLVGLPAWVVQRLWWAVVLCVAFLGVVRLARLLGVTSDTARIIGGLAFALAPRMITEVGVVTVEILPFALAPWVVIPLVEAARGQYGLRRAAMLSGLAFLFAGGVNAVATAALVPVGLWWILTRFRGRACAVLIGWWGLAIALASLWWAIPLLILGRYSPPFLDWIESSSVTTLITTPDAVVRGASQWVAYVVDSGGPVWPGGWQLVTQPVLIAAAGLVAAGGLAGLALRSTPYRPYLVGLLLMGLVLVSMGHLGVIQGLAAGPLRELLDGPLAPLRNTHKFDLLLRLPLALGVAFGAQAIISRARGRLRAWAAGALVALVVVGAWPAITGSLARDRSFEAIPGYWGDVASWLADAETSGRALVIPGASFGIYTWGRTQDEPLQPLATTPWAVRDAVPLSSAGNIRWLDAVQERLDTGRGSPGLADALARSGVSYVVVRNDVNQRRSDSPRTVLIRQALVRSGGFTPVAGFGPALPPYRTEITVVDSGLQDTSAAVEVWRVDSPYTADDARVWLRDASEVLVTSGSAESVVDLLDSGVLTNGAVLTSGDEPEEPPSGVGFVRGVTDGFLRTEVNVGRSRDNRSEAMTADQGFVQDRRVPDYYVVSPDDRQAVAVYEGGLASASSSGSDPTALRARSAAAQPWAALDGDLATAWISGDREPGVGQWWQVVTEEPVEGTRLSVRLVVDDAVGAAPAAITVTTDTGEITSEVRATDRPQSVAMPPGPTRTVRLTLAAVADGSAGGGFGIREVTLPGSESFTVVRRVVAAGTADGGPIVLTARRGERAGCAAVSGQLVCAPSLSVAGEERSGVRRVVNVARDGEYRVSVRVRPRAGIGLDRLLRPIIDIAPRATASSSYTNDPATRPQSAVDDVISTAWVASPLDERPELYLTWGESREVRGIRLDVSPDLFASKPLKATIIVNGRSTTGVFSGRGAIRIPKQAATAMTIRFDNSIAVRNLDPSTGQFVTLPIGVNEVRILGAEDIIKGPRLFDLVALPCGFGPDVTIDGGTLETQLSATVSAVLNDALIPASPCDSRVVSLAAGRHVIDVESTEEFTVESVTLEPVAARAAIPVPSSPEVLRWDPTQREVAVAASSAPRILELGENANPGWIASISGQDLVPVRVDGWRQGWWLPAGLSGTAAIEFAPDGAYRWGLAVGAAAALLLLVLALGRRRPGVTRADVPTGGFVEGALVLGAVLAALLVGGIPGAVAAFIGAGLGAVWRRAWVAAVAGAGAAFVAALAPWPQRLESPDVVLAAGALLALLAVSAVAAPDLRRRRAAESDATMPGSDARE